MFQIIIDKYRYLFKFIQSDSLLLLSPNNGFFKMNFSSRKNKRELLMSLIWYNFIIET